MLAGQRPSRRDRAKVWNVSKIIVENNLSFVSVVLGIVWTDNHVDTAFDCVCVFFVLARLPHMPEIVQAKKKRRRSRH